MTMMPPAVAALKARQAAIGRKAKRSALPKKAVRETVVRRWEIDTLPHQTELLNDTTTKILGMCSGFGGGKTWSAARKAVQLALLNPGCDGIVTEPTIPLLVKVMFPELEKALREAGLRFKFNKQDKIFYVRIKGQVTRILCDSMENYTRLIGVNAAWILSDEFDTSKADIAMEAYRKLLGRLRAGRVRQYVIVSTPEGFRAMWQIFVKEMDGQKRLIKAKTTDNTHLPADYIDTLRSQYPGPLIEAYINGEFVNLTSGAVYSQFSRTDNHCDTEIEPGDTLLIGMDFNVTHMAACVYVKRTRVEHVEIEDTDTGEVQRATIVHEEMHMCEEIVDGYDTPAVIAEIQERWPAHCAAGLVEIFPDSSGKSRKTVDAGKSDIALLEEAGFVVCYNSTNPAVRDRINAVNGKICNAKGVRTLFVNTDKCPRSTECLEQQVWGEDGQPDKTAGNDHQNDAAGYPIAHLFPIVKPVVELVEDEEEIDFY